jgi:putative phosphonate catabolism associated alcohol dehydrogenase
VNGHAGAGTVAGVEAVGIPVRPDGAHPAPAAPAQRVSTSRDESGRVVVCLTPAASARVWTGPHAPHETIAVPGVALEPGEALVRVELATVCGSDVHTVLGHRSAPAPLVLGHEYVGRIVALGAEVVRAVDGSRLAVGDRVVWSVVASCERCDRCRHGMPQKCRMLRKYGHERIAAHRELTGGFATHVHLEPGTAIVRVDEDAPAEILAPLSCGTATAWAALDRAERIAPLRGGTVLVTGAGLIGLTVAAMAADRGCTVIVSDPDPERRELATGFGAHAVVGTGAHAIGEALAALGADEIALVVEASGSDAAVATALEVVGVGGVVVLAGSVFPTPPVPVDPERVVRNLLTVAGVHNYAPADLAGAAEFLRRCAALHPFAALVGETLPLDRLDDAIALAATGAHVRVGVRP